MASTSFDRGSRDSFVAAVEKNDGVLQRKLVQCAPLNTATRSPDEVAGSHVVLERWGGVAISQVCTHDGEFDVVSLDENKQRVFVHRIAGELLAVVSRAGNPHTRFAGRMDERVGT